MNRRAALLLSVLLMTTVACTQSPRQPADTAADAVPLPTESSGTPTPSPSPTQSPNQGPTQGPNQGPTTSAPEPVNPVSLPALMRKKYDGRGLRLLEVNVESDAYTEYRVSYKSGSLTISGVMHVPRGTGPFPVLVLAHGYIDPDIYDNGQGLSREQVRLAEAGYVTLHTDYRGHAFSDDRRRTQLSIRLGYTEDVINAVLALRKARLPYLDKQRIGLLGRSMGGGVVYNALVTRPGLVDAAVVYAPVSSDAVDNFNKWTREDEVGARIIRRHGSPRENPRFWRGVSPRTYFDRITEPVLIQHGTADESCPIRWSRRTQALLERAGVDSRLLVYPGAPHAFIDQWPESMDRTIAFFRSHLQR